MHSLRASPVFALAVLVTLGLAGFNASMVALMALGLNSLLPGPFAQMTHFQEPHHRTHDLTFGFIFVPAIVGMLAQFRRPSKNVAGMVMALVPWVGLTLTGVLTIVLFNRTNVFGPQWTGVAAVTLIATILHPTWRDFFRSFSVARINWVMLALVIIAAAPLLVFASTNIWLQGNVPDDHALMGHYGFMAAFAFTVIGVGLLASLRPDGWWLPAWVAGLLPALLGLTSLVYPDVSSSLGLIWALAAIAWGIGFVATAELTQDAERPTLLGSWGIIPTRRGSRHVPSIDDTGVPPGEDRPPGTPRWVNVLGGIALVVVLVLVGNAILTMVTGGDSRGPGLHGPGGPGLHGPGGGAGGVTSSGSLGGPIPPEAEPVRARFESYTVEQAAREGYVRDEFCLDAAALGQPAERGAMGFHATNETLLRGPIDSNRPQALLFDAQGRVLGVEYEVMTDAVSEPPRLFGQTFVKLPAHPGVEHEHYALHLWFIENPSGAFADFNPSVSCPPGSTPQHGPGGGGH